MKLIPLSEYIIRLKSRSIASTFDTELERIEYFLGCLTWIYEYTHFLQEELTLGMFIPCDEEERPMPEPREEDFNTGLLETDYNSYANYFNEYQEAKSKVFFKGFKVFDFREGSFGIKSMDIQVGYWKDKPKYWTWGNFKTIEDLANSDTDLELTDYAIQKLK